MSRRYTISTTPHSYCPAASRNGGKNKFDTHDERNAFIHALVHDYDRTRLRCLNYVTPLQALANQPAHNTIGDCSLCRLVDILELRIAIGMACSLKRLPVRLAAKAKLARQPANQLLNKGSKPNKRVRLRIEP